MPPLPPAKCRSESVHIICIHTQLFILCTEFRKLWCGSFYQGAQHPLWAKLDIFKKLHHSLQQKSNSTANLNIANQLNNWKNGMSIRLFSRVNHLKVNVRFLYLKYLFFSENMLIVQILPICQAQRSRPVPVKSNFKDPSQKCFYM